MGGHRTLKLEDTMHDSPEQFEFPFAQEAREKQLEIRGKKARSKYDTQSFCSICQADVTSYRKQRHPDIESYCRFGL
jgi:hypothetical protein